MSTAALAASMATKRSGAVGPASASPFSLILNAGYLARSLAHCLVPAQSCDSHVLSRPQPFSVYIVWDRLRGARVRMHCCVERPSTRSEQTTKEAMLQLRRASCVWVLGERTAPTRPGACSPQSHMASSAGRQAGACPRAGGISRHVGMGASWCLRQPFCAWRSSSAVPRSLPRGLCRAAFCNALVLARTPVVSCMAACAMHFGTLPASVLLMPVMTRVINSFAVIA
mmetsp:Transcript_32075/g.95783  ORF Transcript_32075/g.95783 Transcript_32075/m.95783 type:complete len:227 (-) Transcript_32075:160-840(-)